MSISTIFKSITRAITNHAPTILAGVACAGVVSTTVMAVKATPHAQAAIQVVKDKYEDEPVPRKELLKAAIPYYVPTFISAGVTIGCIAGSRKLSAKENTVLASLASTSNIALREYQQKVIEKLGEQKEREVRDEIAQDHVTQNPVTTSEVIVTNKGNSLCRDEMSGRYFLTSYDELHRIENRLGRQVLNEMWATFNDLYCELGLSPTAIGDDIGWDPDHMPEFMLSATVADDGRPCLVLNYRSYTRRKPW